MNASFSDTIALLTPELRLLTRRFTRNQEDSEDLVQETLLKALKYADKFKNNTNLKGWLFTIMRNTFINNYHRAKASRTKPDTSEQLYHLHVEDTHTDSRPEGRLHIEEMWKSINNLKESLLTPFKMYITGYSYKEIADHLEIPIGTVKNRIFQARQAIQNELPGY